MAITYAEVAAQAAALSSEERFRLAAELLLPDEGSPRKSVAEFIGANGPIRDNVDARIRRGRDE